MSDFVSPKPTGFDAEAIFHQETHDLTRGPKRRIRNTSTVRADYTVSGIYLHAKPPKSSPAAPASGITLYTLVGSLGDYTVVKDDNGVLHPCARPHEIRCSVQQLTIEGFAYTYSYLGTGILLYLRRGATKTSDGSFAIEGISPPYVYDGQPFSQAGSKIAAFAPTNSTGAVVQDGDLTLYGKSKTAMAQGSAITLMEIPGRVWMVLADQDGEGS